MSRLLGKNIRRNGEPLGARRGRIEPVRISYGKVSNEAGTSSSELSIEATVFCDKVVYCYVVCRRHWRWVARKKLEFRDSRGSALVGADNAT